MNCLSRTRPAGSAVEGRRPGCALPLLSIVVVGALTIAAIGSVSASADPPVLPAFDGAMSFPAIREPSYPEDYSWEMHLGPGTELEAIDDQHAGIYFTYEHVLSYLVTAGEAHDATGATVPTSLVVSEGNVITLIVHHRDGNPAAGGASFVYPVLAGQGYEMQFSPVQITGPLAGPEKVAEAVEPESCIVPTLRGKTLRRSKVLLREADCKIGK